MFTATAVIWRSQRVGLQRLNATFVSARLLLTLRDSAKGVTKGELVCAALALSFLQGTGRGEVYQLLMELVLEVAVCIGR